MGLEPRTSPNLKPETLPRGSYPTPFLGYLVLWLGSVILKSRRPKKGVGYEPLGTVNPIKLETGLRPDSAGIPYTLLSRIEAIGFPAFGLLLFNSMGKKHPN